ncbi:MAG TPA: hypothetical protein VL463_30260 [Kofleriaceae bacterium]|nr:hypothetical protein [Kofleriaceae bacterium]
MLVCAGVARADSSDDTRPASHALVAPAGVDFTPQALPADVHVDPPADGWWKKKGMCPRGKKPVKDTAKLGDRTWTGWSCGGEVGPYSATTDKGDREAWWKDADEKWHGGLMRRDFAYEDKELYLHGVRVGHFVHRALDGTEESFADYRDGHRHGLANEALGNRTAGGYYVSGFREGTWFVWNTPVDLVRAKLSFAHGLFDGEQRWWTRDGKLLARGSFKAGDGTWKVFAPDGARSEMTCKGKDLIELTAWDRSNTITVHACGPAAPSSCKAAIGPTEYRDRQKLGAEPGICDPAFDVPPLGLF